LFDNCIVIVCNVSMNPLKRLSTYRKQAMVLLGLCILLPLSSCAVFSYRAHRWEKSVSRDPDGVLTHAKAKTWEGVGPSILLVHGFGDGPHVWNKLGPELATSGYHVRALRLPGWNEPLDVKRSITRDDWRNQVLKEANVLRERNQPLLIMAHSLGACIVSDLVQSGRLTPDAIVLYSPLFRVSDARSPIVSSRTWFHIGTRILPDSFIIESIFQEQAQNGVARPPTKRDPFNPKNVFIEMFQLMDEREAAPMELPCPLYLIVAEQDRVINTPVAMTWFDEVEAPVKKLRKDPTAGHAMPLDLETLAETRNLLVWFDQQGITP